MRNLGEVETLNIRHKFKMESAECKFKIYRSSFAVIIDFAMILTNDWLSGDFVFGAFQPFVIQFFYN